VSEEEQSTEVGAQSVLVVSVPDRNADVQKSEGEHTEERIQKVRHHIGRLGMKFWWMSILS
jgi:hypothetical protein